MRLLILITLVCCQLSLHAQELPKTLIRNIKSGKEITFNKTFEKGKVTLVSFWATWCIPGKREVKTIVRQMTDWKKQADFNYMTIAVDQQDNAALARTYALAQGWTFACYIDANSDLKRELNFLALPYIMIIDKKGKVIYTHTGYEAGGEILQKLKEYGGR